MTKISRILVALAVVSGGETAMAGDAVRMAGDTVQMATGQVTITLGLPVVLPTLVVVQPGVSVIPNQSVEVFYSGGYYWTRQGPGWYRSHDHNGGWARVDDARVPVVIARSPPGQYKHYKGDGHGNSGNGKGNGKSDKKDKKDKGHD
jgi:hypothetical protein